MTRRELLGVFPALAGIPFLGKLVNKKDELVIYPGGDYRGYGYLVIPSAVFINRYYIDSVYTVPPSMWSDTNPPKFYLLDSRPNSPLDGFTWLSKLDEARKWYPNHIPLRIKHIERESKYIIVEVDEYSKGKLIERSRRVVQQLQLQQR